MSLDVCGRDAGRCGSFATVVLRTKDFPGGFVAIHETLSYYQLVTYYKQCLIMLFVTEKLPLAR
jgi:hypothetical protein